MNKGSPRNASDNLAQQLAPIATKIKAEDFKSWPYPLYESAGTLGSRMIVEASSYQTTPRHSPPPAELSCPSNSVDTISRYYIMPISADYDVTSHDVSHVILCTGVC
jgi:hypothetical protein